MNDDVKDQQTQRFNLGDYLSGFIFSVIFNVVLIIVVFMAASYIKFAKGSTWGIAISLVSIAVFYMINIFIISRISPKKCFLARGWTIALVLLSLPLLFVGLCINTDMENFFWINLIPRG